MDISYSSISTLSICGKRIVFKRQGIRGPMGAALVYGSVLHHALRREIMEQVDPFESVADAFDCLLHGMPIPGDRPQDNWNGKITFTDKDPDIETMRVWIPEAVGLYRETHQGKPEAMELRLNREFDGFRLIGYPDALWNARLIDFKLGNDRYKPDPLQAACYAILCGGPTVTEFHIFRKKTRPEIDIVRVPEAEDPEYLKFVEENILPGAAAMLALPDLPANPGHFLCNIKYCGFWAECMGKVAKNHELFGQ